MPPNAPRADIVVVDNDDSFTGSLVDAFRFVAHTKHFTAIVWKIVPL